MVITGETSIFVEGESRTISGGGAMAFGIPPTITVPVEPLEIRYVGIRSAGRASDSFVLDGSSENEVIVRVSFSGCPVPDGNTSICLFAY